MQPLTAYCDVMISSCAQWWVCILWCLRQSGKRPDKLPQAVTTTLPNITWWHAAARMTETCMPRSTHPPTELSCQSLMGGMGVTTAG